MQRGRTSRSLDKRESQLWGLELGRVAQRSRHRHLGRSLRKMPLTFKRTEEEDKTSEEEVSEDEAELDVPEIIGENLNLSKKKLKNFPRELLGKTQHVQYLYLEGNKLRELPEEFFPSLPSLKWLDLRNNNLSCLPVAGLKHHNSLEVILLQGNRIRDLPVELSTIPTLKGLQTTGNPITNVPYEVIAEGFQSVLKHLEKLRLQEELLLPASDTIVVKASTSKGDTVQNHPDEENQLESESRVWNMDKLSQWRHFIRKKSENLQQTNFQHKMQKNVSEKQDLQQPKISVSVRSQSKLPSKVQPFRCGVYNRNRHRAACTALRLLKMKKTRLGYKRKPITPDMIQEKAKTEFHKAQVREILEKQAKKIQRMRDRDVLKNWRGHSRMTRQQIKLLDNYQQYPSKNFADMTPFDVDPEFLNMLNRADLYKSLKEYDNRAKKTRKSKTRLTVMDLDRQMNEIIKRLKSLDTNETEESLSPRSKQVHMCSKMDKIADIQKTLKNLQKLNSSMITPVIKTKPKN